MKEHAEQVRHLQRRLEELKVLVRIAGGELVARLPGGHELEGEAVRLLAELERQRTENPGLVAEVLGAQPSAKRK